MLKMFQKLSQAFLAAFFTVVLPGVAFAAGEEFNGPMPGWLDLRKDFGAAGDGVVDDTVAWELALAALPEHGKAKADSPRVLYVPAGTYRITRPLVWENRMSVAVIGEHPENTKVVYDGPVGQNMLTLHGVSYSKFGRITWDGANKARAGFAHQWNPVTKVGPAVTYMEHSDQIFKNLQRGIIGGAAIPVVNAEGKVTHYNHGMDAEFVVRRCRFIDCSQAGISIESFNALDWWIWDSTFRRCAIGVTNAVEGEYGGGHFHVYRSLFQESSDTDIRIGHGSYFGLRLNHSAGSRRFLDLIRPGGYKEIHGWPEHEKLGAQVAIQGNLISECREVPIIRSRQHGPLLLLDNVFAGAESFKPLLQVCPPTDGSQVIAIGNAWPAESVLDVRGKTLEVENTDTPKRPFPLRGSVDFLPLTSRPLFSLKPGASAADIQKALDEAAAKSGQRPIVHLSAGKYRIESPLRIPPGADLQLIGDGLASELSWSGEAGKAMLTIEAPARASLRDFSITTEREKVLECGIFVRGLAKFGGRILLDQAGTKGCKSRGFLIRQIGDVQIQAEGAGASGTDGVAWDVVGDQPWIGLFGYAGSNSRLSFQITNGAKLMVWDAWYETASNKPEAEPRFVHLNSSGMLTLFNGHIATLPGNLSRKEIPAVDIERFDGEIAFLNTQLNTLNPPIRIAGSNETKLLFLGAELNANLPILGSLDESTASALACRMDKAQAVFFSQPPDNAFLLRMLKPARTVLPWDSFDAPLEATLFSIHRVMVRYGPNQGFIFDGQPDAALANTDPKN